MKKIILAVAVLSLAFTGSAYADYRAGAIQAGMGVGMGANPPTRADFEFTGEFFLYDDVSVGLDMDVFVRGATTFGFVGFGRYHLDIIKKVPELVPYVGGGLGGNVDTNGNGNMDIELPNFGFWYELTDQLFIGPSFSMHILTNFSNTSWDLTLIFAELVYRF